MRNLFSKKIENIHKNMMECHRDSERYSPTITGAEREIFNRELFQKILPTNYRIGAGCIVDSTGDETGQIDAVIELPFSLSFPISSGENRLYLADTIGAAFEIKSDLNKQWDEAIRKVNEIKKLDRIQIKSGDIALLDILKIPAFIIAFKGPKNLDTIYKKLGNLQIKDWPDGILIIEHGVFYGRAAGCNTVYEAQDPSHAILSFISCLYKVLHKYSTNTVGVDNYHTLINLDKKL